jgi:hypothetical protein
MRLSKSDVLLLSKVLFHYGKLTSYEKLGDNQPDGFVDLLDRLEEFLTGDEVLEKREGHSGESATSFENDEDDDEDDGDEEDEEEDEVPTPSDKVLPSQLHELAVIEVEAGNKTISLEFEEVDDPDDGSTVDVLTGDGLAIEDVQLVRRTGKVIELWADDGGWHGVFEAKKLPKAWKTLFRDGVVYEVE